MAYIDDPKHLLRRFIVNYKWSYLISVCAIILSEAVMVQFPHILGNFTDALQAGRLTMSSVTGYTVSLLGVGVAYVLLYGVAQLRNGQLGRQFEYELRGRLFTHWELLSAGYFRTRSIGDLLNHAMNDVRAVRDALSGGVNILTNAVFLLAATLFMTFRTISVKLTLVSIVPILFIPLFVIWWGPRIRTASRAAQEALSDMADLTEESLSAIRLIKATANEDVQTSRFSRRVDVIVSRQMNVFRQSAMFQSLIPFMGSISFGVVLLYGGYLTIHKDIGLGAFVAFTLYLAMLIGPLQEMGFVFNYFQRASASLDRLAVLLCEEPEIQDAPHPVDIGSIRGDISFRLTSFSYADGHVPALHRVAFTVKAGQTVGIVGRTGSGKTTLANLLPRIFDAPPDSVFVDGIDVRQIRLSMLRKSIAYVPQDGFLFSTTIGENIGFSEEGATPERIRKAAEQASFWEEIESFPDGLETVIGERGVTLSGGQKQRAAIARAFLKDAPILIMDDSLSAVDMNTEKSIIETIRSVRQGKTTIIIAHRLSAVRHADLIVVLDGGTVVEQGTHDELMTTGGPYVAMVTLQETQAQGEVLAQ